MGKFYKPFFEKINTAKKMKKCQLHPACGCSDDYNCQLIGKKMELAMRSNAGKLQWSLVDFESLEDLVRVLEFGAEKYERDNWKKGLPVTKIYDSLMRHIIAFFNKIEDVDPESGVNHIGHMMANVMFLAYMYKNKKELDDR